MTTTTNNEWEVIPDASDGVALEALADDRIWNAFSIADLEPPFRVYSRIAVARQPGSPPSASCLLFESPAFNGVVPHGDPAGVAAILASVDLPTPTGTLVRGDHAAQINNWYAFPKGVQVLVRMATDTANFKPAPPAAGLVRLDLADLEQLLSLYAEYPENHFVPIQLEHGVYFGVREDRRLVAAGGTHVVSTRYGIAVLGGIFTLPAARGRGYASAVTSALVSELLDRSCRDVVLNVNADNETARRVYDRLGFLEHCRYESGEAVLREKIDS
jgi:GNAT superfamily N-acetyltransferase